MILPFNLSGHTDLAQAEYNSHIYRILTFSQYDSHIIYLFLAFVHSRDTILEFVAFSWYDSHDTILTFWILHKNMLC
jgi:hypothetical protein